MAALLLSLILIVYPNAMAALSQRWRWDQWHAFMVGNAILGCALLAYAGVSGLWPAVWGRTTAAGLAAGLAAGGVPLLVILVLMFLPGQLGRDIVASGIGAIPFGRFLYRVVVQVALTTVLFEEFAFRGVLQALLATSHPPGGVVAVDAAVFGLWHTVLQYNGFASQRGLARLGATAGGTLVYALLGVLLALVRQDTGGLAPAIVAHGVLDVLMFVGMYVRRSTLAAQERAA
jgi:membrane protease YdiL (CAAX protease family)